MGEQIQGEEREILESIEMVIFGTLQEALDNVAKYSGAGTTIRAYWPSQTYRSYPWKAALTSHFVSHTTPALADCTCSLNVLKYILRL
jgi:hypothetical protein